MERFKVCNTSKQQIPGLRTKRWIFCFLPVKAFTKQKPVPFRFTGIALHSQQVAKVSIKGSKGIY